MAEDKAFEPSQKKLNKAKNEGKVPRCPEITHTIQLSICFLSIFYMQDSSHTVLDLYHKILKNSDEFNVESIVWIWQYLSWEFGLPVGVLGVVLLAITYFVEFWQVGIIFSFEKITPKLSNISMSQGIKRIFGSGSSKENCLIKVGSETLQVAVLSVLVCLIFWNSVLSYIDRLIKVDIENIGEALLLSKILIYKLLVRVSIMAFGYSVIRYYLSRRSIKNQLMMSFDELRREIKEDEGDPNIKSERKSIHQEIVLHGMIEGVKKAKVIISDF